MPVRKLDHYNLLTLQLDETLRFYTSVLGMRNGPFPGTDPAKGAWIYDEAGTPVVHIQAVDPEHPEIKLAEIKGRLGNLAREITASDLAGSGSIEHVAFECDDYDGFIGRIESSQAEMRTNDVPAFNLRQIFLNDPNGVTVELNFR